MVLMVLIGQFIHCYNNKIGVQFCERDLERSREIERRGGEKELDGTTLRKGVNVHIFH